MPRREGKVNTSDHLKLLQQSRAVWLRAQQKQKQGNVASAMTSGNCTDWYFGDAKNSECERRGWRAVIKSGHEAIYRADNVFFLKSFLIYSEFDQRIDSHYFCLFKTIA